MLLKLVLAVFLSLLLSPSILYAMDGIEEEKKFCLTSSPIYLKKASAIKIEDSAYKLERTGFKVFECGTHKDVGYIISEYNPSKKYIEISWFFIKTGYRSKGYGTQTMRTIEGVYKHNKKLFPEAQNLWLSVSDHNKPMLHICKKLGYVSDTIEEAPEYFLNFKKEIPSLSQ